VTVTTNRSMASTLTAVPFATAFDQPRPFVVPGLLWRTALVIGDVLGAMALALCIPVVILAVGIPIALCLRLLLWITGML